MENSCSSSSCTSCGIESAACPAPDRNGQNVVSRARPPRRGVGGSSGGGPTSIPATQVVFANPNGSGGSAQSNKPTPPSAPTPAPPPPPQPKLVPQPAIIGTPSVSTDIATSKQPVPASTTNGGKGLVPGSPEYCAQFPETELCRQGKAPPPPSPATPIYCGDPGAHPELCTERPVSAPAPKPSGAIGAHSQRLPFFAPSGAALDLEQCLIDFVNMTPGRQITTIQASGPLGTYATSSDAIVGIRNGRFGAADSFVNFMRSFRSGSPEIAAFCAAVTNTIAPAGYVPQTGYHTPPFGSAPAWDARYSVPSPRLPAGQVQSGCISPPAGAVGQHSQRLPFHDRAMAPSGAIGAHSQRLPFFAPSGAALDHDGYLDLFVQLPADAQANVLSSLAFGQGEVRDPYAHFLAGLLRRGELMFNGEPVAELAVSHIKNFANRAQAPSARGLIDLAIMQEGTAYGFFAPSNNGFAPPGHAAPQANQPPPGFTPGQWGALLDRNPEVAARLWTEFQQRPSTFSQVSGSLLQAANVVLSQLNASRAAELEERRADFAHQQAMARIQIDRENAAAQRLAVQPQQPPAPPVEQPPAPPVQQPPAPPVQQPPAPPASMSTGTMAALGLGVVAIGGGGLYLATRKGGSRSARNNGFLDGLFGKSKGAKKPAKKAR